MNKKKIILILLILIIVGGIVYFISQNISIEKNPKDQYSDYTPQEEISDEQLKQTNVKLYFLDVGTNELKSQNKLVNSTDLLNNPYNTIVQKLIEGPDDETLQSVFPENTQLLDTSISNNCVTLNFSQELLNFQDDTQKFNIINSILNSLVQLNEVESIKILINNEPVDGLDQEYCSI